MRVIFTQTVAGVAKRDEVKEVSDGYAVNYLLPRGLAIRATPALLRAASLRSGQAEVHKIKELDRARTLKSELAGKIVSIFARAAEGGTLYAKVRPEVVSEAIAIQLKLRLEPRQIVLPESIKTTGDHAISLHLHDEVEAQLTLRVGAS